MGEERIDPADASAARRFWWLQVVRLAGVIAALLGALIVGGAWHGVGEGARVLGPILLIGGTAGFFLLPRALARRWRREGP